MFGKSLLFVLLGYFYAQASFVKAEVVLECKDNGNPLQPYPGDCTRFFECTNQGIEVHDCPDGLHFNPGYLVCDYPASAGCREETPETTQPPAAETTPAPLPETTVPEVTTLPELTTSSETEQFDCPIEADLSFRPHPTNCNQFYQCYGGEAHIFTCQEGLHFNPAEQVCDYPENVGCVGGTAPPPTPQAPETTPEPEVDTTPVDEVNTTPSGETEQFDCPIDADLSFRPHPTNCNQFYQCYGGESYIFTCQEGLHFNPAEQVCDYPENVGCVGGIAPPASSSSTTTTTTVAPPTTGNGASDPESFECRLNSDELYHSVSTNCNQFYQCSEGYKYIFNCQAGLQFNYEAQACDYPENVSCANA